MQKALLNALLTPNEKFKQLQDNGENTKLMAYMEELKTYPFGDVWNYFCEKNQVPVGTDWFNDVEKYEREVLLERKGK